MKYARNNDRNIENSLILRIKFVRIVKQHGRKEGLENSARRKIRICPGFLPLKIGMLQSIVDADRIFKEKTKAVMVVAYYRIINNAWGVADHMQIYYTMLWRAR